MNIFTILGDEFKNIDGYLLFFSGVVFGLVLKTLFKICFGERDNEENKGNKDNKDNIRKSTELKQDSQLLNTVSEQDSLSQELIFIDSNKILKQLQSTLFSHLNFRFKSNYFDSNKDNKENLLIKNGDELNKIIMEAQIKYELRNFLQIYLKDKRNVVLDMDGGITGATDATSEVIDKFILYLDKMDILK